jgi:hypothetical protein
MPVGAIIMVNDGKDSRFPIREGKNGRQKA